MDIGTSIWQINKSYGLLMTVSQKLKQQDGDNGQILSNYCLLVPF